MGTVGCGTAEDAVDEATAAARLSGDWSGTWKNDAGKSGVAVFHVEQDGLRLTGKVTFQGNSCLREAMLDAHIEGAAIAASLDFGNAHVKYEASLFEGTSLDGVYEAVLTGGPCDGDRGVLSLVK